MWLSKVVTFSARQNEKSFGLAVEVHFIPKLKPQNLNKRQ